MIMQLLKGEKMKYPKSKVCKVCGDKAILIIQPKGVVSERKRRYYYHYSRDYNLGCHQRMDVHHKDLK